MQTVERSGTAPPQAPVYRFTVDEYVRMAELGILDPDVRTELVDGVIVVMSPKNPPHIFTKNAIHELLANALRPDLRWQVIDQDSVPITLREMPEPDLAVVPRLKPDAFVVASEMLLVVEVADTSLRDDLGRKRRLYASANIPNYWVADVNAKQVHRFADSADGDYRVHEVLDTEASLTVPGTPDPGTTIPVASFFG